MRSEQVVRWRRLATAALLALGMVAAGCQNDEAQVPAGTVPETVEPAPEPADPYAIPDEIDADYIERVLAVSAEVEVEIIRELRAAGEVTEGVEERIRAVWGEGAAEDTIDGWEELLELDPGLTDFVEEPGSLVRVVEEILEDEGDCVVVRVTTDFSPQHPEPLEPVPFYVQLEVAGDGVAPNEHNPTPWLISGALRIMPDTPEPEGECDAWQQ